MDNPDEMNYLMFENDQNNCWLDASIVLIANSKTFKNIVESFQQSQIKNIISTYTEALAILNDNNNCQIQQRIDQTRKMLQGIQKSTLHYLRQFLKFKPGEPESAFCALLNLIYHDKSRVKENISISWIWQKVCNNCGNDSKSNLLTKPIITLPKVNNFHPECPTSVYTCSCKEEQEMMLIYKELPNCLIFHFEKGAGNGKNIPMTFTIDVREYHLTGIVILEKSSDPTVSHFVTWIREPFKNMWLDCNDLNTCIVKFSQIKPEVELKDLYMCVYEAFDDLGKISHKISADEGQTENVNAELIYLSDEGEDPKSTSNTTQTLKYDQTMIEEELPEKNHSENAVDCLNSDLHYKTLINKNGECNNTPDKIQTGNLEKPFIVNLQSQSLGSCISSAEKRPDTATKSEEVNFLNDEKLLYEKQVAEEKFVEAAARIEGREECDVNGFDSERQKLFSETDENKNLSCKRKAVSEKPKTGRKKPKTEITKMNKAVENDSDDEKDFHQKPAKNEKRNLDKELVFQKPTLDEGKLVCQNITSDEKCKIRRKKPKAEITNMNNKAEKNDSDNEKDSHQKPIINEKGNLDEENLAFRKPTLDEGKLVCQKTTSDKKCKMRRKKPKAETTNMKNKAEKNDSDNEKDSHQKPIKNEEGNLDEEKLVCQKPTSDEEEHFCEKTTSHEKCKTRKIKPKAETTNMKTGAEKNDSNDEKCKKGRKRQKSKMTNKKNKARKSDSEDEKDSHQEPMRNGEGSLDEDKKPNCGKRKRSRQRKTLDKESEKKLETLVDNVVESVLGSFLLNICRIKNNRKSFVTC